MRESILRKFVPGPGKYDSAYSTLNAPPISLKSRIPDKSLDHLKKVIIKSYNSFQDLALTTINKLGQKNTTYLQNTCTQEDLGLLQAKGLNLLTEA